MSEKHSYHDLHITTAKIPRTSIFNLPYGLLVTCTRTGGWELWETKPDVLLAGEFHDEGLRLDVGDHVIVDSLSQQDQPPATPEAKHDQ